MATNLREDELRAGELASQQDTGTVFHRSIGAALIKTGENCWEYLSVVYGSYTDKQVGILIAGCDLVGNDRNERWSFG